MSPRLVIRPWRLPRRPLTVALLLAAAGTVSHTRPLHAQRERAVVRVEQFDHTAVGAPSTEREPRTTTLTQRSVQLNVAQRVVRDDGNTMLLFGAQWRQTRVGTGQQVDDPSTLHVATADLWMLRTLNARHTLVTVLRPGLYGDGADVGEQLRLEGAVFVDRIVSPRTTVGLGMSYASNFGRVLPVPVVHVVARPRRRVLVDALLPARADVWWLPRKGLDLGVGAALAGAQYGVSARTRVGDATDLWLANATLGPQLRWTPRGKVQFTADAGLTVLRRFEYVRNGERVADLAPGNVGYARAGAQLLF